MKQEGKKPKKRISFLMPYIDFCFMLIIIFVGMLSIAYFEPLGKSMQTTQEKTIDNREGMFDKKPIGIQMQNKGLGDRENTDMVTPLVGARTETGANSAQRQRHTGQPSISARNSRPNRSPSANVAANGNPLSNKSGADLKEFKELLEKFKQQQKEIEELKKNQNPPPVKVEPGDKFPGNHFYIDLRSNGEKPAPAEN
jgi:hypothetical protein